MSPVTLHYDYFSDSHDQWNWLIESTLYWAFCLFSFYSEVRGRSTSIGASGWFCQTQQSSVTQFADGTQRHSVGSAVSESLTSDSTLTPVIWHRQHLSAGKNTTNMKHFTQHQIATVSRCVSTICCPSFDLLWRSLCAFLWYNDIRYKNICGGICLYEMFFQPILEQYESSHSGKTLRSWRREQGP